MEGREKPSWRGFQIFFAGFFLFLFVLALLSLPPKEKVLTVGVVAGSYWGVPEGDPYGVLDTAIARFEAAHPGVRVRYTPGIRREDYAEFLAEKFLAGEAPDVFLVPSEDFAGYVSIHALTDLTPFLEADGELQDALYPSALAAGMAGGRVYALPLECDPRLMFVNRTLLAREGIEMPGEDWTWQDFYRIAAAVTRDTDGDGELDQFGYYGYTWQDAAVTNGAAPFDEAGEAQLTSPAFVEALRFSQRLRETRRGHLPGERDFDLGRVAFRPFDYAAYRTYQPYPWRIKRFVSFEWEALPLPKGPAGGASPLSVMVLGVAEASEEKELAFALLKELAAGEETQRAILAHGPALPVRRSILTEAPEELGSILGGDAFPAARLASILETGRPQPRFPGYGEAMGLVDQGIRSLLEGGHLSEGSLLRLQKEVRTLRRDQSAR